MAGKIEEARTLYLAQIECVRADIVAAASQKLESLRARMVDTFGAAAYNDSGLVRDVRDALHERRRLIASISSGQGNADTDQHIMELAERRLALLHPEALQTLTDAKLAEERFLAHVDRANQSAKTA